MLQRSLVGGRLTRRRAFFIALTVPGMIFSLFGAVQAFSMMSLQDDMEKVARATAIRLAQGSLDRNSAPAYARGVLAPWKTNFEVDLVFPGDLHGIDQGKPSPSFEVGIEAPISALSGFGVLSLLDDGKIRARAFLTPRRAGP